MVTQAMEPYTMKHGKQTLKQLSIPFNEEAYAACLDSKARCLGGGHRPGETPLYLVASERLRNTDFQRCCYGEALQPGKLFQSNPALGACSLF